MDLAALIAMIPEQYRDALQAALVEFVRRYALGPVNGLALLADIEALKAWARTPLASPEPSSNPDSIAAAEGL